MSPKKNGSCNQCKGWTPMTYVINKDRLACSLLALPSHSLRYVQKTMTNIDIFSPWKVEDDALRLVWKLYLWLQCIQRHSSRQKSRYDLRLAEKRQQLRIRRWEWDFYKASWILKSCIMLRRHVWKGGIDKRYWQVWRSQFRLQNRCA